MCHMVPICHFLADSKVFSYILCLIILICVELKNIVVVARWLCVVTGEDLMQYVQAVRGCRISPLLLVISCCSYD